MQKIYAYIRHYSKQGKYLSYNNIVYKNLMILQYINHTVNIEYKPAVYFLTTVIFYYRQQVRQI